MTTTTIISRQDFHSENTHWTPGMIRHIVDALGIGNRVAITTDRASGQTFVDATLLGMDQVNNVDYVAVATTPGPNPGFQRFRVCDLGHVIVPINRPDAAREAAESYRAEQAAAIAWGKAHHGRTCVDGEWIARPTLAGVRLVFVPADKAVTSSTWQVSLAVLRNHL